LSGGEALHLRGANGAGKTSLLRVLAGVAQADDGTVQRPEALLYLGHANAQAEELSLRENLSFAATLAGHGAAPTAVDAALVRLGLGAQAASPVRRLSQGQRRRGALALLALPQLPPLWLLDEPYNALDTDGVVALDTLLAEHRARGGAVLLTAHASLALPALRQLDLGALPR
jgi:heme exporter protein A